MKKIISVLLLCSVVFVNTISVLATDDNDLKDSVRFVNYTEYAIEKDDERAKLSLEVIKDASREYGFGGKVRLVKTGEDGLDLFVVTLSGAEATKFNDAILNALDGKNEYVKLWDDYLTTAFELFSSDISDKVGRYYALAIEVNLDGEPEIVGIYWRGLVFEDNVNPENYLKDKKQLMLER